MTKRGRKPKLTVEMIDQICLYIENGNTNKDAVLLSGITEAAFYKWKEIANRIKDAGRLDREANYLYFYLLESIKKAESKFRAYHISNINAASKKEWTASAWMLERRYPNEFGKRGVEIEVPVKVGDDVEEVVRIYVPDNGRDG
jgi:hypothetical protein